MNKNILRAFKRELISIYEVFEGSNLISGFRDKIKEFSDNLLFTSNFDSANKKDFNYNKFYTYVAILINYWRMKKLVRTDEEKEQLKLCYEVIYSYSHQKFSDFISIPEVATLIKVKFYEILSIILNKFEFVII